MTQGKINIRQAIAKASALTGDVIRAAPGPRGWGYAQYSTKHGAWWAATPSGYNCDVTRDRSRHVAALALTFYSPDVDYGDAMYLLEQNGVRGGVMPCFCYLIRTAKAAASKDSTP